MAYSAVVDFQEAQQTLPVLIDRASRALLEARTSAEVLEARDIARVAYDAAKSAGRIAKAKQAHDEVIAAVHRAQADALLVEARAKMRLADEYDAAQTRGEVARLGSNQTNVGVGDHNTLPTAADIGLRRDEIHEARKLRDAEAKEPGKAERVLTEIAERGEEPTKAALRREMIGEGNVGDHNVAPSVGDHNSSDSERRKLEKLTTDALIDEVLGLRADLADAKAELAKMKAERDALKTQVAELSADDDNSVIRQLQAKLKNAENAKWRESEKTLAAQRQVYALKKELKAMGQTEIPL